MKSFLLSWLVRIHIYFTGIKFYKSNIRPQGQEYTKVEIETSDNKKVSFFFYDEPQYDFCCRRGGIRQVKTNRCSIVTLVEGGTSDRLDDYHNTTVVFECDPFHYADNHTLSKLLLLIYLDFLKKELQESSRMSSSL